VQAAEGVCVCFQRNRGMGREQKELGIQVLGPCRGFPRSTRGKKTWDDVFLCLKGETVGRGSQRVSQTEPYEVEYKEKEKNGRAKKEKESKTLHSVQGEQLRKGEGKKETPEKYSLEIERFGDFPLPKRKERMDDLDHKHTANEVGKQKLSGEHTIRGWEIGKKKRRQTNDV